MLALFSGCALAQTATSYDPRLTFSPVTLPQGVNGYRSSNGAPGPQYWQNDASYEMHATLDTAAKVLRNDEIITYTNNSPDVLPSVWIQLEQNTYRKDSRAKIASGGGRRGRRAEPAGEPGVTSSDGYVFDSVEVETGKTSVKVETVVSDTRMQVRLVEPLKHGGVVKIHMKYHYAIPGGAHIPHLYPRGLVPIAVRHIH